MTRCCSHVACVTLLLACRPLSTGSVGDSVGEGCLHHMPVLMPVLLARGAQGKHLNEEGEFGRSEFRNMMKVSRGLCSRAYTIAY